MNKTPFVLRENNNTDVAVTGASTKIIRVWVRVNARSTS
jgi:hypothetical protein